MPKPSFHSLLLFSTCLILLLLGACGEEEPDDITAYTNVTIWTGTEAASIQNAALIVRDGRVSEVVPMTEWALPDDIETVDLTDHYIIPGLINAHGHVGVAQGLETGPGVHSRENVINQLQLYARYGITTVVSLGGEPMEAFEVRDQLDPAVNRMARLFLAGSVLNPSSPAQASGDVSELAEHNPDWAKFRVDDFLGQGQKMSADIFTVIIEAAHDHSLPVASHMVTLEDAKELLRSQTDLLAHSIRDEPVDDELLSLMLERDICITPTLTREVSTFIYADRPDFFDDPFFLDYADPQVIEELQQPDVQQRYTGMSAAYYREALPLAMENMMRIHNAGIRVAMGTDSGMPARFQGYFEHMEMAMMQDTGMNPAEILLSATLYAAECMQIDEHLGTLEPGKHADFIVLSQDPFEDIINLREIESVYIGGVEIDR